MKTRKTKKLLDESSYYTGAQTGSQAPETTSAYEFSKDSVPTLSKMSSVKDRDRQLGLAEDLPFPLQDSLKDLANLYLKTQDLRNKARQAESLPLFKGKEKELNKFRRKLNGIMVACRKLAADLDKFSLAPK